uniref:Uncharacterized protein n=1 Tax=Aegilops tauschii subsp. strangulata TaxID=200361 RepID=A0A453RED1_AEGTS
VNIGIYINILSWTLVIYHYTKLKCHIVGKPPAVINLLCSLFAAVAAAVAWKHCQAYATTKKLLPWGFYTALSALMICFYSYVLLAGGNPPPKKKPAAAI